MTRWLISIGTALLVIVISAQVLGPVGLLVAVVASFLGIVARHDNQTGTFLPLAVLFVIVIGVCLLLLILMAVTHRGS